MSEVERTAGMTTPDPTDRLQEAADQRLVAQCPGCWAIHRVPTAADYECECGERVTIIDLRSRSTSRETDRRDGRAMIPNPDERVQCIACHRWPMVKNWPNHMQSQDGRHWPTSREAGLDAERLRQAFINYYANFGSQVVLPEDMIRFIAAEYARLAASPVTEEEE